MTTDGSPFTKEMKEAGVRIIDFQVSRKFQKEAISRIRQELIEGQYDILHLYNNKAIVNGIMAARGLPVKVVTYRGYTGNIEWWNPIAYFQHLSPGVDMITCVSPAVKEVFNRLPFFRSSKAVVVSKGHEASWYENIKGANLQSLFNIPENALVVGIVANARKMKGMKYLVEAIRLLPDGLGLHFLFIGRGLEEACNAKMLKESHYANDITFAGYRSDVLELLSSCDISLLPSVKGEGLSKVLLESMFLGLPTIMTNIAGNRHLAIHGKTAWVVPPKSPAAIAEALKIFASDSELRKALGVAGKGYVSSNFSAHKSSVALDKAYRDLLES
jgi:glycosyltransferase involved in cell wall biosynthesis